MISKRTETLSPSVDGIKWDKSLLKFLLGKIIEHKEIHPNESRAHMYRYIREAFLSNKIVRSVRPQLKII